MTQSVAVTIDTKLREAFAPEQLVIINESDAHAGHGGSPGTGESHFRVRIVSEVFSGKSRVERSRAVHAALKDELAGPVHALAIEALTPAEAAQS